MPEHVDKEIHEEMANRFTYHAPKEGQQLKYELIREKGHQLALHLVSMCPESRELSVALTKLDEVVMWANAAIARRE